MVLAKPLPKYNVMSRGFVKDYEDQWLHEIAPTLNALVHHLTRESNGIVVYEKRSYKDADTGKDVHEMSNGLSYSVNDENQWFVLDTF